MYRRIAWPYHHCVWLEPTCERKKVPYQSTLFKWILLLSGDPPVPGGAEMRVVECRCSLTFNRYSLFYFWLLFFNKCNATWLWTHMPKVSVYNNIHLPRSHLVKVQHRPKFKNSCSLIKADELVGQGGEARWREERGWAKRWVTSSSKHELA